MKNSQSHKSPEEIDIIDLFSGIKSIFKSIGFSVYRIINFLLKNILWLILLVVVGVILGLIIDNYFPKKYKSEIYVVTNIESSTYLYNYVENFDSEDYIAMESPIESVEIEPVKDIFSLAKNENFELLKVLLEEGDNTDFIKEESIKQNYKYHKITFVTKNNYAIQEAVNTFLERFNQSPYLQERLVKEKENIKIQIKESFITINKINDLFSSFGIEDDAQLNVQTFSNLGDVLAMKNAQIDRIKDLENKLIELKKPVYIVNGSYGTESYANVFSKLFLILPLLFLLFFFVFKFFASIYKKYKILDNDHNKATIT